MQPSVRPSSFVHAPAGADSSFRASRVRAWTLSALALSSAALAIIAPRTRGEIAPASASGVHVCGELHDYHGHPESVAAWTARGPQTANTIAGIDNRFVREIVMHLRHSDTFQGLLPQIESERRQRFRRDRAGRMVSQTDGSHVRETALAVWIPRDRGELGVYRQPSGEVFSHSNFASDSPRGMMRTHCDVVLTAGAAYHIRMHTHPWGTVPSAHDLANAVPGVVDMVFSEKDGVPTVYIYSARGSVWEIPTRLFRAEPNYVRATGETRATTGEQPLMQ